jgi:VCBS repeat-containing protein
MTIMNGSNGDENLTGTSENDVMNGGNGDDTLAGGDGNDALNGGNGEDTLLGDDGNDTLSGGNGDDTLDGGAGSNTLLGGNGDDSFIEVVSIHSGGDYDFIDGQKGSDILIIEATEAEALLLSQAIEDFNNADKSQVFHFGVYANGLLNVDVVNVEQVQLVVISGNSAPLAVNDTATILEHASSVIGNVLVNDSDPDQDALNVVLPGAFVGSYGMLAIMADGSYTYTLNPNVSLPENAQLQDVFTYQVTDGSAASNLATLTIAIQGVNDAPTDILISNGSVVENEAGALIGNLTAMDPDMGDAYTFSIVGGADAAKFEIVGNVLKLKEGVSADFEIMNQLHVTVQATDQGGLTVIKAFDIDVIDAIDPNEAPVVTSALATTAILGVPFSFTVTAMDSDTPLANLTYEASSLPNGLTFDPLTQVISGTPTMAGIYKTGIMVSDGISTTMEVMEFSITGPELKATADGQIVDGINSVAEILSADGYHAVLKPGMGDTVLLNFHHDPTFFNSPLENSIDTSGSFQLVDLATLAGSLNLLVSDASVSGAVTPIKTINFDFDSSLGVGLDPNGETESIYVTNATAIEYALETSIFGAALALNLARGFLSPTINIHIDPNIRDYMADSPNDQINVYQGYSYSINLTNESMVPVHFEDRWGSTHLISNPFAPTDDIVLVDAGLNSTLEVGTTFLQPYFINSYDGGMGNDTLVVDLANMTKEDKAVFVNFKAAFDAMNAADQMGIHTLYQDATHSAGADRMYSITFQNFENVQLLHAELTAGAGNDVIVGTGGDDVLEGYLGSDLLTGGAGSDVFVFDYANYKVPLTNPAIYTSIFPLGTDTITDLGATDSLKITNMIDFNHDTVIDMVDLNVVTTIAQSDLDVKLNVWVDANHDGVVGTSNDVMAMSIVLQGHAYNPVLTHASDYLTNTQVQFA